MSKAIIEVELGIWGGMLPYDMVLIPRLGWAKEDVELVWHTQINKYRKHVNFEH